MAKRVESIPKKITVRLTIIITNVVAGKQNFGQIDNDFVRILDDLILSRRELDLTLPKIAPSIFS